MLLGTLLPLPCVVLWLPRFLKHSNAVRRKSELICHQHRYRNQVRQTFGYKAWKTKLDTIPTVNEGMKETAKETAQHHWRVLTVLSWDHVCVLGKYVLLQDGCNTVRLVDQLIGPKRQICLVITVLHSVGGPHKSYSNTVRLTVHLPNGLSNWSHR